MRLGGAGTPSLCHGMSSWADHVLAGIWLTSTAALDELENYPEGYASFSSSPFAEVPLDNAASRDSVQVA